MYSIVIPCYNSSHTIRKVVEATAEEMNRLERTPFQFVLVDDHSPDGGATAEAIKALSDDYDYVTSIELAINAGQHNAIMAGLNYAEGDYIISMDDDMQTHPSQLQFLLDEIDKGYDVVYGYYPEKKHSPFRNFGSWFNHASIRWMIGKPKAMKTSSFWVIKRFIRDYVIQYTFPYPMMQGLFLRTTNNISCVPIQHFNREHGNSNYTFRKLIKLWSNSIGFSTVPLKMARHVGFTLSLVGLIGALLVIIRKITHANMQLGWASTMVSIFFFSGVILLFLGLIGEYIGRMFLGVGNSPQYVIRNVYTGRMSESAAESESNQMQISRKKT